MQPKPDSFDSSFAESFKSDQVVAAYRYRPPYPPEVFDILESLISEEPRTVLDVGAGSGDLARQCVGFVERVDAVDFSQSMIERGKRLPNGDNPRLHWIYGKIEDVPLTPPYALITAGSSIHWPDWSVSFPRFKSMLTPGGFLVLVYRRTLPMPWEAELRQIRRQFSRRQHGSANAIGELEARGFFLRVGQKETAPIPFFQSVDEFITGLHSRSGFASERMGPQAAADFDRQVRDLLAPYYGDGMIPFQVVGTVTWGKPEAGETK